MCQEAVKYLQGKVLRFGSMLSWLGEVNHFDALNLIRLADCPTCSFPTRSIREIPASAADTVGLFLHLVGSDWKVFLPSPFVVSTSCRNCTSKRSVMKPLRGCVYSDLSCDACGTANFSEITKVIFFDNSVDPAIVGLSLSEVGVPFGATLFAECANETILLELSNDCTNIV
jgi:hypothetical protein